MTNKYTKNRGFTLVELMISFTVLAVMLGAVGATVLRGQKTYDQGMTVGTLEAQARQALDRIAVEFAGAVRTNLNPTPVNGSGTSTCTFRKCTGFGGGAMLWTPNSVQLQPSPTDPNDGIDNNSNGLIDECQVVFVRNVGAADEQRVTLAGFVREYFQGETLNGADENGNGLVDERGLSFSLTDVDDDSLTIRLTLEALDSERRVITRSVETAVHVRN